MSLFNGMLYEIISLHRNQNRKFKELLEYTERNSRFYEELYKDIDTENLDIKDIERLPIVTKRDLVSNYERWLTEEIAEEDLKQHAEKRQKVLNDKYIVASTSGTTGDSLLVTSKIKEFDRMMAAGIINTWPKKKYMLDILFSGRPVVYILPTGGLFASYLIADNYLKISRNKKSKIIDLSENVDSMINQLNWINPILIGGYVSTFKMLAKYIESGKLSINTKYMVPIGTRYTEEDREYIAKTFKCETFTSYSCTECGEIGHECSQGHFHISPDIIVEPVDKELKTVGYNKESDSLLVTNLWNFTSPLIRYKLNDRCILHGADCACGSKEEWLEILGRKVDESETVPFRDKNNSVVEVASPIFWVVLNDTIGGKEDHQLIIEDNNITLILTNGNEEENQSKANELKKEIERELEKNNIKIEFKLSEKKDRIIEESGKVKRIKVVRR